MLLVWSFFAPNIDNEMFFDHFRDYLIEKHETFTTKQKQRAAFAIKKVKWFQEDDYLEEVFEKLGVSAKDYEGIFPPKQ